MKPASPRLFCPTLPAMLKRNLSLVLVLAVLCQSALVRAAEDVPPPKPPLLASTPDPGDWTLVIKNPGLPAPESGVAPKPDLRIVEVHSTQRDKLKRDILTYANGTSEERWFVAGLLLWKSASGEVVAHDMTDSGPGSVGTSIPSVPSGFVGLDWLSLSNYKGAVTWEKRNCYHFSAKGMDAWIDVETKFPVALKVGDYVFQYTFNAPPAAPLNFPTEFQATWDLYQSRINKTVEFQKSLRNNP